MNLSLILLTAAIQLIVLFVLRKRKTFALQLILSGLFLALHIFLLPKIALHYADLPKQGCGMPFLGHYLVFWMFGGCATIMVTAFSYLFWSRNGPK